MRRALSALLIGLLAVAPAAAQNLDPPARMRVPRTSPRADDGPVGPVGLRPRLQPAAPRASVVVAPPPASLARVPLGASRLSRRPVGAPASYVSDRTGSACRTTCATQRYQCMAGDDPDGCGAPWSQCIASCSQVADSSGR